MPATIPTRPAGGAIIDTTWGQDMHDRMYSPKGVVAAGAATAIGANADTVLSANSATSGNAAWLDGTGQGLKCPVNHSGWYHVEAFASVAAGPAGGSPARIRILRNGGLLHGNTGVIVSATGTTYLSTCATFLLNDNDVITIAGYCTVAATFTVNRLSILRTSNGASSS